MLIRSSLLSSNPLTLPDTIHLLSEAESKTEKSKIYTKNRFSEANRVTTLSGTGSLSMRREKRRLKECSWGPDCGIRADRPKVSRTGYTGYGTPCARPKNEK